MSEPRLIVGDHLRATPDGRVVLRLTGRGMATVTLRAARPITPRWLGSARPRLVRFGRCEVDLRPGDVTTVSLRLSRDHLALLHRMQSVRVAISVQTPDGHITRRIDLHSPLRTTNRRIGESPACPRSRDPGGAASRAGRFPSRC